MSEECRDLVDQLLQTDPDMRLGHSGSQALKEHPWFRGLDWDNLARAKAAFVPQLDCESDTSYFDAKEVRRAFWPQVLTLCHAALRPAMPTQCVLGLLQLTADSTPRTYWVVCLFTPLKPAFSTNNLLDGWQAGASMVTGGLATIGNIEGSGMHAGVDAEHAHGHRAVRAGLSSIYVC